jgi:hypothetical protein
LVRWKDDQSIGAQIGFTVKTEQGIENAAASPEKLIVAFSRHRSSRHSQNRRPGFAGTGLTPMAVRYSAPPSHYFRL